MALVQLTEKIIQNEISIVPHLYYWLLPLLRFFSQYQSRLLVVLATRSQVNVLEKEFQDTIATLKFMTDEDFLLHPSDFYDYLFFLGECFPDNWPDHAHHIITIPHPSIDEENVLSIPPPRLAKVQYNQRSYTLAQRHELLTGMARQAAELAYTNPGIRILLLVSSSTEVDSLFELLRKAQLPLPVNTLTHAGPSEGIIIGEREASLVMASQLYPTYTFDILVKKRWLPTWSQGRRLRDTFVSKAEADYAKALGGVVHRMITYGFYTGLEDTIVEKVCLWREWLLHDSSVNPPLPIERCWSHLSEGATTITPELKQFLLSNNLGIRPALVLWKWYQDELPLFPMISLIALIDSYGPPYFQYPLRTPDYEDRESEYQTLLQRHNIKYFSEFASTTDLAVLLKLWLSLLDFAGGFDDVMKYAENWSLQHSIDLDKVLEVCVSVHEIITYFQNLDRAVIKAPFDINVFLEQACPYFEQVYSDRLLVPTLPGSSIYRHGIQTYLKAGSDYTMTENPDGPVYALVVHEEKQRCILWLSLPQKIEREEVELILS